MVYYQREPYPKIVAGLDLTFAKLSKCKIITARQTLKPDTVSARRHWKEIITKRGYDGALGVSLLLLDDWNEFGGDALATGKNLF